MDVYLREGVIFSLTEIAPFSPSRVYLTHERENG